MDTRSSALLALTLVVGILVGVAGTTALQQTAPADSTPELGDDPPYYMTAGSTSAIDAQPDPHAGWLHEVQMDDTMVVTGNATVVHPANTDVDVEIEASGQDDYVIRLTTEPTNETKADQPQQTRVEWGASLSSDYGSVELWAGDERLRIIENDEATTPRLFQLPNPIDLRA